MGVPLVFTEVVVGDPADQIAATAASFEADLVVVGPHGGRPPRWSLLGTTAERVGGASEHPVLVGRDPRPRSPVRILVPVDELELSPAVHLPLDLIAATARRQLWLTGAYFVIRRPPSTRLRASN